MRWLQPFCGAAGAVMADSASGRAGRDQDEAVRARLRTLPVGPSGSASVNRTIRGYVCRPSRSRDQAMSSSAVTGSASVRATTTAQISSPRFSSGTPITATSETAGCRTSTSSTSRG